MKTSHLLIPILLFTLATNTVFSQHKDHAEQHQRDPDRERFYWQMPERVIEEVGIKEGMTVADVGCGNGYFTLRIAERVGLSGKVYASDIDKAALQSLKKKASEGKLENIKIIYGKADNPMLPAGKIDLVLLVNVIHLIEDPEAFFSNIALCLKEDGYLVIVQWDAKKMDWELREWDEENRKLFTMRTTLQKIYEADYEVYRMETFLPMQNIYFCKPQELE